MRNLIKKNPKYSKRINYNALKDLFVDTDEKDSSDAMYTIEAQDDGMGMEVIEESGAVGEGAGARRGRVGAQTSTAGDITDGVPDDEDADGEDEGSDKGDEVVDTGWEDVYEQEV